MIRRLRCEAKQGLGVFSSLEPFYEAPLGGYFLVSPEYKERYDKVMREKLKEGEVL